MFNPNRAIAQTPELKRILRKAGPHRSVAHKNIIFRQHKKNKLPGSNNPLPVLRPAIKPQRLAADARKELTQQYNQWRNPTAEPETVQQAGYVAQFYFSNFSSLNINPQNPQQNDPISTHYLNGSPGLPDDPSGEAFDYSQY